MSWTKWTYDYPTVPTIDLKIHPVENDLIIGTFGRGAYILDDIAPLEFMARSGFEADSFEFVSAPDAYLANYKPSFSSSRSVFSPMKKVKRAPPLLFSPFH